MCCTLGIGRRTGHGRTMQTHAPTLTTDRLTLRAHRAADFDGCYDLWTDDAVIAFIGGLGAYAVLLKRFADRIAS